MNIREISEIMKDAVKVHFIGIGGISMSSLAMITAHRGYTVTGSDKTETSLTNELERSGISVKHYHSADNIEGASLVVHTAAVKPGNPELDAVTEKGIPLCSRADYLGWLMSDYKVRIGVSGTHGKSGTTSMLSEIYLAAKLDPTVVNGAVLSDIGGAYRIGNKEHFIFEACEYCDSFLSFIPTTAIITNIEYDHADYFKNMSQLKDSFVRFADMANNAVVNLDDSVSNEILDRITCNKVTYSVCGKADFTADDIEFTDGFASYTLVIKGKKTVRVKLGVPGRHNISNSLAAAAAAITDGVSPEAAATGLSAYRGAKRRFEFMGKLPCGAPVYNDYAHHPTEIRATLAAAKEFGRRVVCVFQPHTYSRTVSLFDGFVSAFGNADVTLFADIYSARETDEWGISSEKLAAETENGIYLGDFASIADYIKKNSKENDMIMILGAGDIIKLGDLLLG